MANIKKSFNFRNGVQVDDDNLRVSATGLVGIGTTVPTEALDVRGNLVVSGVTSAVTLQAGVATITTLNPTEIIGAGVSIKSGIVTASSGIITYFGDGINLLNLPTSQWEDTIVGAGVSSIYNTGGNVGIATTAALFTLQVGNDVNSNQKGVGISSFGDIKASGIVTATGFVGDLTGDVTGNVIGNNTGNVTGDVNSSGVSTFTDVLINRNLKVSGISTLGVTTVTNLISQQLDVSGISTIRGGVHVPASGGGDQLQIGFVKNNLIDVTGIASIGTRSSTQDLHLSGGGVNPDPNRGVKVHSDLYLLKQLDVTGASTFRQPMSIQGGGGLSILNGGGVDASGLIRTTNQVKGDDGLLTTDIQIGQATIPGVIGHPRLIRTSNNGPLLLAGYQNSGVIIQDVFTCNGNLQADANIICGNSESAIGVGTDSPAHDIQVRKPGAAEIQVTSDTNSAGITVGREPSSGKTNNAEFRYGFTAGSDYNTSQSLDIINYGTDNFNYYLSANNPGAVTGNYFWHKGLNNVRLMTLTNTGRLGIGITAPTDELDVQGGVTVSGNITVGNNVTVSGTVIGNLQGTVTGNVAGTLAGNTNTTVGISTLNNLSIAGIATAARLRANKFAIGENPNLDLVSIFISNTDKVFVNDVGQVGIKTTIALSGVGVNGSSTNAVFNSIGIGITQFTSAAVDLRDAGTATSRYMIPPKVDNGGRGGLQNLVSGAMIYNTSINKLQVYNGSAWETVTSS